MATKAIVVKFMGPTNTRGARLKATAHGVGSMTVAYQYDDFPKEAAELALKLLHAKFDPAQQRGLVPGGLPNGDMVFIIVDPRRVEIIT